MAQNRTTLSNERVRVRLPDGVVICRMLLFTVVLLLFNSVNVGDDDDEWSGDDIRRTVCGD
jgi:hypothetical protein